MSDVKKHSGLCYNYCNKKPRYIWNQDTVKFCDYLYFVAGPDAGAGDGEGGDRPHEAHDRRVLRGRSRGLPRRGLAHWHLAGGAIPGSETSRRAHQHFQQLQVSIKAITNI